MSTGWHIDRRRRSPLAVGHRAMDRARRPTPSCCSCGATSTASRSGTTTSLRGSCSVSLCACIGRSWMSIVHLMIDWLPFILVVIAYDLHARVGRRRRFPGALHAADRRGQVLVLRACADRMARTAPVPHELRVRFLGQPLHRRECSRPCRCSGSRSCSTSRTCPTTWRRSSSPASCGSSHGPGSRRTRGASRRSSVFGFITYVVFPAAPPWLAAQDGYIAPTVGRVGGRGFAWLHLHAVRSIIENGAATSNLVAAVPSLHAGFATLDRDHVVGQRAEVGAARSWSRIPRSWDSCSWPRASTTCSTSSSVSRTRSRRTSCGTTSSAGGNDARPRTPTRMLDRNGSPWPPLVPGVRARDVVNPQSGAPRPV